METRIERAQPIDTEAVLVLLAQNGLPTEGLREHFTTTVVVKCSRSPSVGRPFWARRTSTASVSMGCARSIRVSMNHRITFSAAACGFEHAERVPSSGGGAL